MKKVYVQSNESVDENLALIHVIMYIEPIFYEDSVIFSDVHFDSGKWITDNNPSRILNGPLSKYGEELEPPLKDEWERFIEDCRDIVRYSGFTIIHAERSMDSEKSEYLLVFGMNDKPCGKLVFDLRISDHALDKYEFPESFKDKALEYLKINKVLDGSATKQEIDFKVEKVLVGSVKRDTWYRAINRLADVLQQMRNKVRKHSK